MVYVQDVVNLVAYTYYSTPACCDNSIGREIVFCILCNFYIAYIDAPEKSVR